MNVADIGIVVPLREEFTVVSQIFPISGSRSEDGLTIYTLRVPKTDFQAQAIVLGGMGPTRAAQLTEKFINHVSVKMLFLLGIAGALDGSLSLGDVIIASEVNAFFASSKVVPNNQSYSFEYSGEHWKMDFSLLQRADNLEFSNQKLYRAWLRINQRYRKQLKLAEDILKPKLKYSSGHIASGDLVVSSDAYKAELTGIDRKFLGIEMEAGGFAQATYGRSSPLPAMVIRGISDFANENKSALDQVSKGEVRRAAVHGAGSFLHALLMDYGAAMKAQVEPIVIPLLPLPQRSTTDITLNNSKTYLPARHKRKSSNISRNNQVNKKSEKLSYSLDLVHVFQGCRGGKQSFTFVPGRREIAFCTEENGVQTWSLVTKKLINVELQERGISKVLYSPDGGKCLLAGENSIYVWRSENKEQQFTWSHLGLKCLDISRSGKSVVTGGGTTDGTLRVWNLQTGQREKTLVRKKQIISLSISPNEEIFTTVAANGELQMVRLKDGKVTRTLQGDRIDHVLFSPDGKVILLASSIQNGIQIWDAKSGSISGEFGTQLSPITALTFSPDGLRVALATQTGGLKFWELVDQNMVEMSETSGNGRKWIEFSSDGNMFAVDAEDGSLHVWLINHN